MVRRDPYFGGTASSGRLEVGYWIRVHRGVVRLREIGWVDLAIHWSGPGFTVSCFLTTDAVEAIVEGQSEPGGLAFGIHAPFATRLARVEPAQSVASGPRGIRKRRLRSRTYGRSQRGPAGLISADAADG